MTFLSALMMVASVAAQPQAPAVDDAKAVRIAVYDDKGSPRTPRDFARVFGDDPAHYALTNVTAAQIRSGVLKNFDVVVLGGGSSIGQSRQLQPEGRAQIRKFVREGGGYIGICAGAYLASADKGYELGIISSRVVDRKHWARGRGNVELGFSPAGLKQLDLKDPKPTVMYHQGPLLAPLDVPGLPPYTMVAQFDTEVAQKGAPHGVMQGTTALASAAFGKGRVFIISPHPEQTAGEEQIVRRAVDWVSKRL